MRTILMAVCVTTLSLGCEQAPVSDVREGVQEVIEDARTRADELRELSAEELQDLWAIEYRSLQVTNADLAAGGRAAERVRAGAMGLLSRQ